MNEPSGHLESLVGTSCREGDINYRGGFELRRRGRYSDALRRFEEARILYEQQIQRGIFGGREGFLLLLERLLDCYHRLYVAASLPQNLRGICLPLSDFDYIKRAMMVHQQIEELSGQNARAQ